VFASASPRVCARLHPRLRCATAPAELSLKNVADVMACASRVCSHRRNVPDPALRGAARPNTSKNQKVGYYSYAYYDIIGASYASLIPACLARPRPRWPGAFRWCGGRRRPGGRSWCYPRGQVFPVAGIILMPMRRAVCLIGWLLVLGSGPAFAQSSDAVATTEASASAASADEDAAARAHYEATVAALGGDAFLYLRSQTTQAYGAITPPGTTQEMRFESMKTYELLQIGRAHV